MTVNTTTWSAIFEAGVDNASRAEFSHEDAADDNYYFAGDYTSAGGPNQLADESLNDDTNTDTVAGRTGNPAIGFERALSELDPVMNIWFVPPPAMVKPESSIRVTADVLSVSGSNALEFSINGNILHTRTGISSARLVQFEVTGLTSTHGHAGRTSSPSAAWEPPLVAMCIFDYVMLEHLVGTLPAISEITHDSILGTHTVNWSPIPGRTYRVEKSTDAGVSWILLAQGFPAGGAPGTGIFLRRPRDAADGSGSRLPSAVGMSRPRKLVSGPASTDPRKRPPSRFAHPHQSAMFVITPFSPPSDSGPAARPAGSLLASPGSLALRLLAALGLLLAGFPAALHAVPVISEFLADNDGGLKDEDGEDEDWIEIFNPDIDTVNLGGWSLTDDVTKPAKWVFPSYELQPGARLIVWASEKNRNVGQLHTNFQLDQDGEYLALRSPGGSRFHHVCPLSFSNREHQLWHRLFRDRHGHGWRLRPS